MDVANYIDSGILELYVAGQLSEKENLEIARLAELHPEIKSEIERIEEAVKILAENLSDIKASSFESIRPRLGQTEIKGEKVRPLPWLAYTGWAAAVIVGLGLFYTYQQNQELQQVVDTRNQELIELKDSVSSTHERLVETNGLLDKLRDRDLSVISLAGQQVAPNSYAKVYWNKDQDRVFVDAKGLPEPPRGMVYQVWSLTLNPLTPVSIGLLDEFDTNDQRLFELANANESEAFGITLEPAGGSEAPTMEQLYALGAVSP